MHEQNKKFSKEITTIKTTNKKFPDLKNILTEANNSIKSFKSRIDHTDERISNLEDRTLEITQLVRGTKIKKGIERVKSL